MTDAVKLLTEAEVRAACDDGIEAVVALLDANNLLAPEPVDPLREAVRAGREAVFAARGGLEAQIDVFTATLREHGVTISPAAPPLTREMVREAVKRAFPARPSWWLHETADSIHSAITEGQNK